MARILVFIRSVPVHTSLETESDRLVKVKVPAGYRQQGLPKLDSITRRPVTDNNTRAAMLQTGEARSFLSYPL